MSFDSKIVHT